MRSVLCAGVLLILAVSSVRRRKRAFGAPSSLREPMQGGFTASFVGERL